jgi:type II secretory pathway predicted ATPase ExeA
MERYTEGSERAVGDAFQRGYRRRFHFLTPKQLQRVATMRSVLLEPRGHVLLSGPGGTGKSTLLERMVEELRAQDAWLIHLRTPPLSFDELTRALLSRIEPDTDVSDETGRGAEALIGALHKCQTCRQVVIVVDEAQAAPDDVLSGLFYFAGLSDENRGARLALLLAGTDGIGDRLAKLLRTPLAQLVHTTVSLAPLEPDEVGAYIRHQLAAADIDPAQIFPVEVIDQIARLSGGVQSEISSLCGLAIMGAQHERSRQVTPEIAHHVWWDAWIAPIEREVEAILGAQLERSEPVSPRIAEEALRDTWIAPIEREVEALDTLGPLSEGPAVLCDSAATSAGDASDLADRATAKREISPVAREEFVAPHGRVSPRDHVENGRSSQSRPWAWAALVMALLTGITSYVIRHDIPAQAPGELVQLVGFSEPSAAEQRMVEPADVSVTERRSANAHAKPAERVDSDAARQLESQREVVAEVVPKGLVDHAILVQSGFGETDEPMQSLPPTAAGLPVPAADPSLTVTLGRDINASQEPMETRAGGWIDASPRWGLPMPSNANAGPASLVADMLERAQQHLAADRLLSPKFDNAFSAYSEVLRIDPGNDDAKQGIESIKARLIAHSRTARVEGDLVGARRALEKVLVVDASDQRALAQLDQLNSGSERAVATTTITP